MQTKTMQFGLVSKNEIVARIQKQQEISQRLQAGDAGKIDPEDLKPQPYFQVQDGKIKPIYINRIAGEKDIHFASPDLKDRADILYADVRERPGNSREEGKPFLTQLNLNELYVNPAEAAIAWLQKLMSPDALVPGLQKAIESLKSAPQPETTPGKTLKALG
jgi:hypothetical protein